MYSSGIVRQDKHFPINTTEDDLPMSTLKIRQSSLSPTLEDLQSEDSPERERHTFTHTEYNHRAEISEEYPFENNINKTIDFYENENENIKAINSPKRERHTFTYTEYNNQAEINKEYPFENNINKNIDSYENKNENIKTITSLQDQSKNYILFNSVNEKKEKKVQSLKPDKSEQIRTIMNTIENRTFEMARRYIRNAIHNVQGNNDSQTSTNLKEEIFTQKENIWSVNSTKITTFTPKLHQIYSENYLKGVEGKGVREEVDAVTQINKWLLTKVK